MRWILPLASLGFSLFSVLLSRFPPRLDSAWCNNGLCRLDQLYSAIDGLGLNAGAILRVMAQTPSNPYVWCAYGELLASRGRAGEAAAAYDQAVKLGPSMPPVLMRTANFDFTHGRVEHALAMTRRILAQTPAFDEILFSYLAALKLPIATVLESALPPQQRPLRSWLHWLFAYGSEEDLLATWRMIMQHRLAEQSTAADLTRTLWNRRAYQAAQQVWLDWIGGRAGDYLMPNRIWNSHFDREPSSSPFDWTIDPLPSSVRIERRDGLSIAFSGADNIAFAHLRQFVTVRPGAYRFSTELQASGLTTDQHPRFHIFDPLRPAALNVQTALIENTSRARLDFDFAVPPGASTLQIQLERHPSDHLDNKFAGGLHLYSVSLTPR